MSCFLDKWTFFEGIWSQIMEYFIIKLRENCLKWQFFVWKITHYWLQFGSWNPHTLYFKQEPSSSISSTLTKLYICYTPDLFAKTQMTFIIQAYQNFIRWIFECKKWNEKGHFNLFLSISMISLYTKHKANLLPIFPILILLLTLQC